MARAVLVFVLGVSCLLAVASPVRAETETVSSYEETPTPAPEPPSNKAIQSAVMRCLSSVDKAIAASRRNPRNLGKAEEGEERYCFEQKKECQANPGGFACRSFIRDYLAE